MPGWNVQVLARAGGAHVRIMAVWKDGYEGLKTLKTRITAGLRVHPECGATSPTIIARFYWWTLTLKCKEDGRTPPEVNQKVRMFMKALRGVYIAMVLFLVGCGGGAQQKGVSQSGATSLEGSWTITAVSTPPFPLPQSTANLNMNLVSSPCNVNQSGITFYVNGNACAVANNPGGQGSITCSDCSYHPQGVLVGASADPAPTGSGINILFVETDLSGDVIAYTGSATIINGSISGTMNCDPLTPICTGINVGISGQHN
jgi:hypothetical protein